MSVYVIATLKMKPGSLDAVREGAMPCIEGTRKEAGCISYDLHQSMTDPDTLVFVERWKSRDDLNAHFHEPHFLTWRDIGGPLFLERSIEIIENGKVEIL